MYACCCVSTYSFFTTRVAAQPGWVEESACCTFAPSLHVCLETGTGENSEFSLQDLSPHEMSDSELSLAKSTLSYFTI
jgi:hypothetical protein